MTNSLSDKQPELFANPFELTVLILKWLECNYNAKFTVANHVEGSMFDKILYKHRAIMHVASTNVWLFAWYDQTVNHVVKAYDTVLAADTELFNKIDGCVYSNLVVDNLIFPRRFLPQETYGPL